MAMTSRGAEKVRDVWRGDVVDGLECKHLDWGGSMQSCWRAELRGCW